MRNFGTRVPYSLWIAVMLAVTLAPSAQATTIHCAAGDIQCLIVAIDDANANGEPRNTIRLAAGIYALTNIDNQTDGPNGLPSITSVLTIEAAGRDTATLTRAANAADFRLLHVGASGHLRLRRVIVSHGTAGQPVGLFTRSVGGGLFNNGGVVTIRDSAFLSNDSSSERRGPVQQWRRGNHHREHVRRQLRFWEWRRARQ